MKDFAELLRAIAALLWPLAVIGVIWALRERLVALIESARSRRFTLKVAGQELTMEEASQQQSNLITDLQMQVLTLRNTIDALHITTPLPEPLQPSHVGREGGAVPETASVLWVDDNPRNNSYLVEQLLRTGVQVHVATSTDAALTLLSRHRYRVVVSDMGRRENGAYNPDAGLDLLEAMRKESIGTPVVFYASAKAVAERCEAAITRDAHGITASPTELLRYLDGLGLRLAG